MNRIIAVAAIALFAASPAAADPLVNALMGPAPEVDVDAMLARAAGIKPHSLEWMSVSLPPDLALAKAAGFGVEAKSVDRMLAEGAGIRTHGEAWAKVRPEPFEIGPGVRFDGLNPG